MWRTEDDDTTPAPWVGIGLCALGVGLLWAGRRFSQAVDRAILEVADG